MWNVAAISCAIAGGVSADQDHHAYEPSSIAAARARTKPAIPAKRLGDGGSPSGTRSRAANANAPTVSMPLPRTVRKVSSAAR